MSEKCTLLDKLIRKKQLSIWVGKLWKSPILVFFFVFETPSLLKAKKKSPRKLLFLLLYD
jgi:hypothetical protein